MKKFEPYIIKLTVALTILIYVLGAILIFRNSMLVSLIRQYIPLRFGVLTILNSGLAILYFFVICTFGILPYKNIIKITYWLLGLALIAVFGNLALQSIEAKNYENFVFGNYGIFLPYLKQFAFLQIPTMIITLLVVTQSRLLVLSHKASAWLVYFPLLLLYGLVGLVLIKNIGEFPGWIVPALRETAINLSLRPEERFEPGMRDYQEELLFAQSHIPEEAVVVHPQQSVPFPVNGNQVMVRYYLYPRVLVTEKRYDLFLQRHPEQKDFYMLIDTNQREDELIVFPRDEIAAKNVWLLLEDNQIREFGEIRVTPEWITEQMPFRIGVLHYSL